MTDAAPGAPVADTAAQVADTAARSGMFRSLRAYNARLYFGGLLLSNIGSWLQLTATSYLVYRLTGNAADLGYNVAFQFLPMLVLGTWAGSFADRYDRRSIMIVTQGLLATQAIVMGVLDLTDNISLPIVWT